MKKINKKDAEAKERKRLKDAGVKPEKVSKKNIGKVIDNLVQSFDDELFRKSKEDLKEYWHFKWENDKSICDNIYIFYNRLKLYESFCRRWEEHHNGPCCIVGRVRDEYLMPKIRNFYKSLKHKQK